MKHKLFQFLIFVLLLPVMPVLGAVKVKDAAASTKKWEENAGRAADAFATEAEASAEEWARNTANAASTYGAAITAAGIKERFKRGVQKAGAAKFARKIAAVAKDRFGPGITAAVDDFHSGVEPYLQTIAGVTLSARKPRGDPANYKRTEEIGKALNAKRLAGLGGGGGSSA